MATVPTTLRLPEELKARVASAAETTGTTSHAFMVEAIEAQTRRYELRQEFVASALKAEQEIAEYGLVYDADAVHRHFRDKLAGKKPKALKPVSLKSRR